MNKTKSKGGRVARRKQRTRAKIKGTAERPRLSVFRSNKHVYAQLIDDTRGVVLLSVSDKKLAENKKEGKKKKEVAQMIGEAIAEKAKKKKIKKVVFDRGAYKYHGRVEAVAEGARRGGLKF
ncbi:50S ribosomal protein L18 [Patescibacteria group bacterium]|nr:50S ribosomal protein L18 [Patescibacteria group bacterium]